MFISIPKILSTTLGLGMISMEHEDSVTMPLKIAVDNSMLDSTHYLSLSRMKHKPAWVSPGAKFNGR